MRIEFVISAVLSFVLTISLAFSQEICDNGIDDDLDGFVDCYDTECPSNPACDGFFVSEDPACEATPTQFPTFSINTAWVSANRTATNNGLSSVGDVDGDGIPEVISTNSNDRRVYTLSGIDGTIINQITLASRPYYEVMHADIDRDGFREIFVPTRSSFGITALSYDLSTVLWTSATVGRPGNIGITDFDEDGLAEIYAKDEIFDAHTGTKMRTSDFNNTTASPDYIEKNINNNGIAVDILDDSECANCAGLEYVVGGRIYSVSINRGSMTATMNLERSFDHRPVYYAPWEQNRSGTSVADYNLDGFLDVLCTGITSTDTRTQVFFWDVQNNVLQSYADPGYNWSRGTGRLNVADLDGDGQLNVTYVTGQYLYALDENWQQLWRSAITESSSGTTGTSVFDFNGDGTFETVYRDESFVYIVNGVDGTFFQSIPCRSLTYTEYPIVADLDADGATEICVTCSTNDAASIWDNDEGQVRVFESDGEQWVTSRKIWNQHGYFNVNINDDGTIPIEMQKHHLIFSNGVCSTGGDIRPLNTFLNQAPFITSNGCANYSAPDLNFAGNVSVLPPQCPQTNFTVSFDVSNNGDREVIAALPVTFYDGDPSLAGSIKLNTVTQVVNIGIGETVTLSDLTVIGTGGDFNLFISVNDNGSQNPPIVFPIGGILECDFGNNIGSVPATALPFTIQIQALTDNNKCNPALPDNGSASVSTAGFSSIYFEDFEDLADGTTNDVGSTAWTRTRAGSTDYAEVRTNSANKEFETRDTDGEVVWRSETIDITAYTSVNISVLLKSASTGGDVFEGGDYIRAYYSVDGGSEVALDNGNFSGAVGPTIAGTGADSETATINGLIGNTIEIVVRMANSSNNEFYFVDNVDIQGFGTVTAGYTFNWYFGSTISEPPDFVGATNTGMASGIWTVYSSHTATGCGSDTVQVTINTTSQNPTVDISIINEFSNCQSPDGQLLAVVNGGAPEADFSFEWYEGLDIFTSPVLGINALATNLDPTTYTVVVTEVASSCQTIRSGTVPASASFPVVDPVVDAEINNCLSSDGAVSATVSGFGIRWLEDFEDQPSGTTVDNGTTAWSRTPNVGGDDWAEVRNVNGTQVFEARDTDTEVVFTTEVIDISAITNVDISVNLSASSRMEVWQDYLRVYYILDGGAEILLDSGMQAGSFGSVRASAQSLNGSTLSIVARMYNNRDDERYRIDNITISGIGQFTSDYVFEWYQGANVKPSPDYTGESVTGLPAGDYTVTASSASTGCTSNPVTVTIGDNTTNPTINAFIDSPQTTCDLVNPNGSASTNVGGITIGHTFNWFAGQNTNPVNEIGGSPNPSVIGLPAGIYTVMATVDSTGCSSTAEITIVDNIVNPIVTALLDSDQTICTIGSLDGQVSASVGGVTAGYTFYWFVGNIALPDINNPDFTGPVYSALQAEDYTVVAVNNILTCVSIPAFVTVNDVTIPPVISETLTAQTSCDVVNPNGGISALANGTDLGYTFNIYAGQNTNPVNEVAGSPNAIVTGLAAGIYTILATNDATGCFASKEVTILDNSVLPVVQLSKLDNTICDPSGLTGQVTAIVNDPNGSGDYINDYTFTWHLGQTTGGAIVPDPDPSTPLVLESLYGNYYTLVVSNDVLNCVAAPVNIEVENILPPITISTTNTSSTNCIPDTNPNGEIVSDVWVDLNDDGIRDVGIEDVPALFTYQWHTGTDTSTPIAGEVSATISNIQGGAGRNYTLEITHVGSGCTEQYTTLLNDESELPIVTLVSTPNVGCAPGMFTGTATATITYKGVDVTADPAYSFTYDWTGPNGYTSTTALGVNALESGNYALIVTETTLGCVSLPGNTVVIDNPSLITISSTNTSSTNCDPLLPNGQILSDVWVDLNDDGIRDVGIEDVPALFTYQWHTGTDTSTPIAGEVSATISNIQGGAGRNYTLEITHVGSGCTEQYTTLLNDESELPIVTLVSTPNVGCAPGMFTGTATATITYKGVDVTADPAYSFTYDWTGPNGYTSTTALGVNALESGNYALIVTETTLGCVSLPGNTVVIDNPSLITISSTNTSSTNCDPLLPNGQILSDVWVDLNDDGIRDVGIEDVPALFTYQWHTGTDTSTPIAGEVSATISNIQGGAGMNYTLEITHIGSGCTEQYTTLLNDESQIPIVNLTSTDNTICDPAITGGSYDGTVTANITDVNGSHLYGVDYTFTWTDGAFVIVADGNPATPEVLDNVPGDDFTLVLKNNVLGCTSLPATITVDNVPAPLDILFTNSTNNSCAPVGNGEILAAIDLNGNGSVDAGEDVLANLADYSFVWHVGNTTTGVLPASIPAANNIDALDGNEFYTLEVTRLSTGCTNTHTEWIQKIITIPDITLTDQSFTDCSTDAFVEAKINNLAGFAPDNDPGADFTYTWYRGISSATGVLIGAPGTVVTATGLQLTDIGGSELPVDDYTVVVTHTNSQCIAAEQTITLSEPPILFDIDPILFASATNCGLVDGVAYVTISDNGNGLAPPYIYAWYAGAPTNTSPIKYFGYDSSVPGYVMTQNVPTATFFTDPAIAFGAAAAEANGADDIGGTQDPNAVLSGVTDGLYTVVVTDATGCSEYITFQIPFANAQQSDIITLRPDTDCTADNSSIHVEVVPDAADVTNPLATDYFIYLFVGGNPALPAPSSSPPVGTYLERQPGAIGGNLFPVVGTLTPGVYTIVSQGTNGATNCFSTPTVVTIEEWANEPLVNLVGIINPNTSCDLPGNPDGSLTIDVQHHPNEDWDAIAIEPTYEIEAVPTDPTYATISLGPGLATGNHTLNNLGPVEYAITVLSSRNCSAERIYTVPDEPVIAEVTTSIVLNTTTCIPQDGSIQITAINHIGTGAPLNITDFSFTWYYDANGNNIFDDAALHTQLGGSGGEVMNIGDADFAGPGIYWVEMVSNVGPGLNCSSMPIQYEIIDDSVDPIFVNGVTANTSCDPLGADGTLFIDPDRNGAIPAFGGWTIDFTLDPSGTLGAPIVLGAEGAVFTATGLVDGQYDYTITDVATSCTVDGSLVIPANPVAPILDNIVYTVVDQYSCTPEGSIEITQFETVVSGTPGPPVTNPGTAVIGNIANYSFVWYHDANGNNILDDAVIGLPQQGGAGGEILDIGDAGFAGAGVYWVEITKTAGTGGIGCTSTPFRFEILDNSVTPTFVNGVTANTSCDPLGADGTLFIDIDRNLTAGVPPFPASGGWTLSFTADPSGTLGAPVVVGDLFTATGLLDGQYDYTITDVATSCTVDGSLVIPANPVAPILDNIVYTVVDQYSCTPEGSIEITQFETVVSGTPGPPVTNPGTAVIGNIANYSFVWYHDANGNNILDDAVIGLPQQGGAGGEILDIGDAGFAGAGVYWVEITKTAGTGGIGCTSTPFRFEILDNSVTPTFVNGVTANTSCDPLGADGTLFIDIDRNLTAGVPPFPASGGWTLSFTADPSGTLGAPVVVGDLFTATGLLDGQYDYTITDVATSCTVDGSLVIPANPVAPILDNIVYTVVDQYACTPEGSIEITQFETVVSGTPGPPVTNPGTAVIGNIANYSFVWYHDANGNNILDDAVIGLPQQGGVGGEILDIGDAGFAGAGVYWVEITKTAGTGGIGCTSTPFRFEILDLHVDPIITVVTLDPNVNCAAPALPTGLVTININGIAPVPAEYQILWYEDAAMTIPLGTNFGTVAGPGNETAMLLPAGNIYVSVTDINTPNQSCVATASYTIVDDLPIVTISQADLVIFPNDNCNPANGSAEVTDVLEDGAPQGIAGYEFQWYNALLAPQGAPTPVAILSNLIPDIYYVQAINTTSYCISSTVEFEILDIATDPEITVVVLDPNINCILPASPTGMVTINIDGAIPVAGGHLVEWFEDALMTIPLGTNYGVVTGAGNETAQNLPAGDVYVSVTDLSSPNQSCIATAVFTIEDDLPMLAISASDILLTPNSNCVINNGSAIVNFILVDGIQTPIAGYEFEWMDSTLTIISGPAPANSINNLSPGTYYVNVRNINSQCEIGTPIEIIIEDITSPPLVSLFDFSNPTRCEGTNAQGNLRVTADGSTNTTDFNFAWYTGGIPVAGAPFEPNNYEVINLIGGDYTVVATDNTSGCYAEETYTLVTEVTELQVAVSSSPVTSCIADNGSIFASVTNTSATYDYTWYIGNDVLPVADFNTQQVNNLSEGEYTVVVVDQSDSFCESKPLTVRVEEQTVLPEVSILLTSSSTHCDPSLGNAQLTASVNGQINGYSFDWRVGVDSTSANIIYTGSTIDNLYIGDYTVVATDIISGCINADVYTVVDESMPIPAPTAEVLSHLTSCLSLNGVVEATISGITREHDFNWYNGSSVGGTPDFTGSIYAGLDVGTYTVTATERSSGCISESVTLEVEDHIVYPDFEIITQNSVCTENSGYAMVNFLPGYGYLGVDWDIDGEIIPAPAVYDLPAGEYEVTVYGVGECATTKTAIVETDILVYNGVSPNSDAMNDIWVIDCIDDFANNNVKIFNRSGQLVYEADYYNNNNISFDGAGNRGIYIMGNNVPDGTYYYIIDKGDGSEARSGFLELFR